MCSSSSALLNCAYTEFCSAQILEATKLAWRANKRASREIPARVIKSRLTHLEQIVTHSPAHNEGARKLIGATLLGRVIAAGMLFRNAMLQICLLISTYVTHIHIRAVI